MAIFYLKTIPVSRSKGQSATAGSAYRAGEKISDERTGQVHDYTNKKGIIETMMFNNFNLTREELWNMSELSNTRKNSRVAREFQVALPHELGSENHNRILEQYANMLVSRYGVAVDIAIHSPGREGDHRNVHAHIYCTTQVMQDGQLKAKSLLELSDTDLRKMGHMVGKKQVKFCRAYWQRCVNSEFRKSGMSERIYHRSNEDRKLSRIPQVHVGPHGTLLARRGKGHLSNEWQINQAIIAYNNVVSIDDARRNTMQDITTQVTKSTAQATKSIEQISGLSASLEDAEEAQFLAHKSADIQQKKNATDVDNARWKPANIDPQKGAVIDMFQQDGQGVYRWTKGKSEGHEAFRDTGKSIHSQTINSWALAAELELAKQKKDAGEWKEIRAFGSKEYRRAVWIQGQTMGIQVEGYKPTTQELAKYSLHPSQGLAGDQKSIPKNTFSAEAKFQNKFDNQEPDKTNSSITQEKTQAHSRSPKI